MVRRPHTVPPLGMLLEDFLDDARFTSLDGSA